MLTLVTGGSGSGKSEYAEMLAAAAHEKSPDGKLYYIAAMYPYDEECIKRIEKHRNMRSQKGFTTIECYTHLEQVQVTEKDVVLLECMSNLLANEMYREEGRIKPGTETDGADAVLRPLFLLADKAAYAVVVSNEVFSDGMEYEEETKRYVRLLGEINRKIGKKADKITEVVCGIPLLVKAGRKPDMHGCGRTDTAGLCAERKG